MSSTPIALPPSNTNIDTRTLISILLGTSLILASGITLSDLITLRHPSPSWLIQYLTAAPLPHTYYPSILSIWYQYSIWDDNDNDNDNGDGDGDGGASGSSSAALYFQWLIRISIALFIYTAAHAQCTLATHRRATPIILRLNPGPWIYWAMYYAFIWLEGDSLLRWRARFIAHPSSWEWRRLRRKWDKEEEARSGRGWVGCGSWIVGYWHPEYFWPLVLMEVGMFAVLPVLLAGGPGVVVEVEEEEGLLVEGRYLREGVYVGLCAGLVVLAWATGWGEEGEKHVREGKLGWWDDVVFALCGFPRFVVLWLSEIQGRPRRRDQGV